MRGAVVFALSYKLRSKAEMCTFGSQGRIFVPIGKQSLRPPTSLAPSDDHLLRGRTVDIDSSGWIANRITSLGSGDAWMG